MTIPADTIGVDVSKHWIDCHRLSTGTAWRVGTSRRELGRFATGAGDALVVRIIEFIRAGKRPLTMGARCNEAEELQ